jgi:glutaredoxin
VSRAARRAGLLLAAALTLVPALAGAARAAAAAELELFTRPGCPHCADAKEFLAGLAARRPELRVVERDVTADPAALGRLVELSRAAGVTRPGVPAFVVRGELVVGFQSAETTGRRLESLLFGADGPPAAAAAPDVIDAPLVGPLSASRLGLPLFTLAIGLLDGFNPCAMWVLLFLLSLLVHLGSRRRMLAVGGTFVVVSGLVYFAFMTAWLNAFLWLGVARAVQLGLGGVAAAMGAIHLKDAFAPGVGPSLRIPESAKPGLYARVRRVLHAENLAGALAGAAVLAFFVNAVELLCTAGLPALYTRILTLGERPWWSYYGYLALYNLAYVADDLLMLTLAVATLGRRRLEEREGRWLNGLSGALMLALGVVLVARPEWLGRLAG